MKHVVGCATVLLALGTSACMSSGQPVESTGARGVVEGRLAACPSSPNCVSSETGTPEAQKVDPFPTGAWAQLPDAIVDIGGVVTSRSDGYIAAEFTSNLFQFVDDLELRLADDAVHVRSASRVGYSDMGANRDRVEVLRERLSDR